MNIEIRKISDKETYPVRHPVLRAGRPISDCYFAGDELETTIHLGGFYNHQLVAVATFLLSKSTQIIDNNGTCYQLRGMAVLDDYQGKQLGKQLLLKGEQILKTLDVTTIWFNARIKAVPFYKKMGYGIISEPFKIEPIGTHYKMYKSL